MMEDAERPLVTLIVVAYNQEEFVREAIEGAFKQTYRPLEIILSDDCSSDRTFQIMQEMRSSYTGPHRVVLNRNENNLGLVPHIDRVMEIVRGGFVVVNAGDDISLPQRCEELARVWNTSQGAVKLVHTPALEVAGNGDFVRLRTSPREVIDDPTPYTIATGRHFILGASLSWDREVFDAFGPLGPDLSNEDHIIPFRAAILGQIAYVEQALVKYRIGGMSEDVRSISTQKFTPHDYLYGVCHKLRKWQCQIDRHIISRFEGVSYPRKSQIEAICRRRAEVDQLPVQLAELPTVARLSLAPRAIALSWRYKTSDPIKHWTMYSLEPLYLLYALVKSKARRLTGSRSYPNRSSER